MIKIGANFQRIIDFFTRKIVMEISKICVWDPGSEIQKEKTYSGSRIPDSGVKIHRIPDPGPKPWLNIHLIAIDGITYLWNKHSFSYIHVLYTDMNT